MIFIEIACDILDYCMYLVFIFFLVFIGRTNVDLLCRWLNNVFDFERFFLGQKIRDVFV